MTTDPIAAARAMIEPLTGYTSAPWAQVSAGDNGYHIGSGGWTVDASDPDGGYFGDWHICLTTGCYLTAEADARLIAAAPDLRDMVPTLADALEAERAKVAAAFAMQDAGYSITTPADAQAALDKMLAEARLEGWRAGRDAAAEIAEGRMNSQSTMHRGSHTAYFMEEERRRECEAISTTIRALPEPKEASHD